MRGWLRDQDGGCPIRSWGILQRRTWGTAGLYPGIFLVQSRRRALAHVGQRRLRRIDLLPRQRSGKTHPSTTCLFAEALQRVACVIHVIPERRFQTILSTQSSRSSTRIPRDREHPVEDPAGYDGGDGARRSKVGWLRGGRQGNA